MRELRVGIVGGVLHPPGKYFLEVTVVGGGLVGYEQGQLPSSRLVLLGFNCVCGGMLIRSRKG